MQDFEKELLNSLTLMDSGADLELVRGDDGAVTMQVVKSYLEMGAELEEGPRIGTAGALASEEIQRTMGLSKEQQLEEAKAQAPGLAGAGVAGPIVGSLGVPGDLAGLVMGAVDAIFPEGDQSRIEAFANTVTEISDKFGSGAVKGYIMDQAKEAGLSGDALEALDAGISIGEFGGIGGVAKGITQKAPAIISKAGDVIEGAGDAAKARMAEGGTTLTSGVDPDPLIAAAGDAVKKARAKYEASPNDPTARREYLDARHKRDAQLSSMPVEEKLGTDVSYRMAHQPTTPQNGAARLDDMTGGGTVFPDDVYSKNAVRFYGGGGPADQESVNIIQAVRGNPEAEVTIYRAVPKDVDTINPGDWVTLSKSYADSHAMIGYGQMGDEAGKVISQKVKVKDVYSDGNDLNEFGYFPEDIAETNVAKLEPPTEKQPGIIAFHGSGADFDEFKLEKIGTGEGARAYGYGLYFADKEDIAKYYKNSVAAQIKINDEKFVPRNHSITEIVQQNSNDKQKIKQELVSYIEESEGNPYSNVQDAKDIINAIDNGNIDLDDAGKMYKVGLEPKPEDMLDWQTPLNEQPNVFEKIKNLPEVKTLQERGEDVGKYPGFRIYKILEDSKATLPRDKAASEQLFSVGIPGIKYRDFGSRGGSTSSKDATFNYVIFDDKMIKILEKYGIVGPVAVTGVAASQQEGEGNDAGA